MAKGEWTYLDVLRERLRTLEVPILGGLPIGHDREARTVPLGVMATLDATAKTLSIASAGESV
jgi:muramoyltetrapeptide carboxypeptidase